MHENLPSMLKVRRASLKPIVRIKNNLSEMVSKRPITRIKMSLLAHLGAQWLSGRVLESTERLWVRASPSLHGVLEQDTLILA